MNSVVSAGGLGFLAIPVYLPQLLLLPGQTSIPYCDVRAQVPVHAVADTKIARQTKEAISVEGINCRRDCPREVPNPLHFLSSRLDRLQIVLFQVGRPHQNPLFPEPAGTSFLGGRADTGDGRRGPLHFHPSWLTGEIHNHLLRTPAPRGSGQRLPQIELVLVHRGRRPPSEGIPRPA